MPLSFCFEGSSVDGSREDQQDWFGTAGALLTHTELSPERQEAIGTAGDWEDAVLFAAGDGHGGSAGMGPQILRVLDELKGEEPKTIAEAQERLSMIHQKLQTWYFRNGRGGTSVCYAIVVNRGEDSFIVGASVGDSYLGICDQSNEEPDYVFLPQWSWNSSDGQEMLQALADELGTRVPKTQVRPDVLEYEDRHQVRFNIPGEFYSFQPPETTGLEARHQFDGVPGDSKEKIAAIFAGADSTHKMAWNCETLHVGPLEGISLHFASDGISSKGALGTSRDLEGSEFKNYITLQHEKNSIKDLFHILKEEPSTHNFWKYLTDNDEIRQMYVGEGNKFIQFRFEDEMYELDGSDSWEKFMTLPDQEILDAIYDFTSSWAAIDSDWVDAFDKAYQRLSQPKGTGSLELEWTHHLAVLGGVSDDNTSGCRMLGFTDAAHSA
tara:strand:- start:466 stop:1779 length:1314 start_codon:yes stop_codon:yes gene_type:complete